MTMAELHASGGIPPGWIFSPPPGDAERGREVFARLGCAACHRVGDGPSSASTGVGPDLTDAGEHHPPGYLLESVINPNAVIVGGARLHRHQRPLDHAELCRPPHRPRAVRPGRVPAHALTSEQYVYVDDLLDYVVLLRKA